MSGENTLAADGSSAAEKKVHFSLAASGTVLEARNGGSEVHSQI